MPKAKTSSASVVVAWWLDEGDEECPHCGQLYIYERELRCTDCDSPVCPHCRKVHAAGHHVCPDCVEAEAPGAIRKSDHG